MPQRPTSDHAGHHFHSAVAVSGMLLIGVQVHLINVSLKSYEQRLQLWRPLLVLTIYFVHEITRAPAIAVMLVVIRADAAES